MNSCAIASLPPRDRQRTPARNQSSPAAPKQRMSTRLSRYTGVQDTQPAPDMSSAPAAESHAPDRHAVRRDLFNEAMALHGQAGRRVASLAQLERTAKPCRGGCDQDSCRLGASSPAAARLIVTPSTSTGAGTRAVAMLPNCGGKSRGRASAGNCGRFSVGPAVVSALIRRRPGWARGRQRGRCPRSSGRRGLLSLIPRG